MQSNSNGHINNENQQLLHLSSEATSGRNKIQERRCGINGAQGRGYSKNKPRGRGHCK